MKEKGGDGEDAGAVHGTAWDLETVRGNAVMAMLLLGCISVISSLQVFGKDRLIFWRESASGASALGPWVASPSLSLSGPYLL